MNRTLKQQIRKKAEKQQKAQIAAVMEMRALVHRIAGDLYVAHAGLVGEPDAVLAAKARECIQAGITFVDTLNAFVPAPVAVSAPVQAPVDANGSPVVEITPEEMHAIGMAEPGPAPSYEPGSVEEMEAHS